MKIFLQLFVLAINFSTAMASVDSNQRINDKELADKIYFNGKVITVDSLNSIVTAIAIKNGKILQVGSDNFILKFKGAQTTLINLHGKTVVPGFIDGHSHFMNFIKFDEVDVSAPPVSDVKNITELLNKIKRYKDAKKIRKGEWINTFGYDQDQLEEKRHLSKEDLDLFFPDNPVTVKHVSNHMTVANSYALRISGIDSQTIDPAGGVIVRKKDGKEPTGLLQEQAADLLKRPVKKKLTLDEQFEQLKEQQMFYASNGITTAQDGLSTLESLELLRKAALQQKLFIDIETLAAYSIIDKILSESSFSIGLLQNHFKISGFKLIADGSPQGKTAFFSKPYLTEVPGCNGEHCFGVPTVSLHEFNEAILKGFSNHIRTFVHCNGDGAIDMYINAIKYADSILKTKENHRPVVIHSQFVRPDQLDAYKNLGIIPAFFSNHAFFWGDIHVRNLGEERAFFSKSV